MADRSPHRGPRKRSIEQPYRGEERRASKSQGYATPPPAFSIEEFPPLGSQPQKSMDGKKPPVGFRDWGIPLPKGEYSDGLIIAAVHHSADFQPHNHEKRRERTLSGEGTYVFSKIRKMIVIELHARHCIILPIFTYNGQGLRGKSEALRLENIGIRDKAASKQEQNWTESKHESMIATMDRNYNMSPLAYCHFALPSSLNYDVPCIVNGRLESQEEIDRLKSLYHYDGKVLPSTPNHTNARNNSESP